MDPKWSGIQDGVTFDIKHKTVPGIRDAEYLISQVLETVRYFKLKQKLFCLSTELCEKLVYFSCVLFRLRKTSVHSLVQWTKHPMVSNNLPFLQHKTFSLCIHMLQYYFTRSCMEQFSVISIIIRDKNLRAVSTAVTGANYNTRRIKHHHYQVSLSSFKISEINCQNWTIVGMQQSLWSTKSVLSPVVYAESRLVRHWR